ncbi:MAG: tetratricopeptide repeat protein [Chitinophagaceae bacterium]|nr:tetratricopeptide repeat protein [Chitinophagaceae bacterium]
MAKVISEKINYKKGIAKSNIYYSSVMYVTGKYDSGIYYSQQALELSRLEKDTFFIGITLFNIGTAHQQMSRPEEALPYFLEGVKLIEKNNNAQSKSVQVQMGSSLQSLYNDRTQYDQSIFYGEKAIITAKELNDKSSLCLILINLSISYREKKMLPKAEELAEEALQLAKELKDIRVESAALLAIASIWEKKGVEYKKILPYATRSLLLSRESGAADMEVTDWVLLQFVICNRENLVNQNHLQEKRFC